MIVKMRSIAIAAAVISGFAASENLVAQCTGQKILYQAGGGFGSAVQKGQDNFKLAGNPFSISLYACSTKTPVQTGPTYAVYTGIQLTGQVVSTLYAQPYTIKATPVTMILVHPSTGNDSIQMQGTVVVFGDPVTIHGTVTLPQGTLTSTSIAPFSQVSIVTAKSAFVYSATGWRPSVSYKAGQIIKDPAGNEQIVTTAGTSGTTQPVWNETTGGTTNDNGMTWTCEGPYTATQLNVIGHAAATVHAAAVTANAILHSGAVQVITAHADGTETVRPLRAAPVDLLASSDTVMLHFYASGVRDASEVHMQIAGQNVPVLYSGASGRFPGLDEVTVELPRSLAGMGQVDAVLTADGQTASPVRVHIQ